MASEYKNYPSHHAMIPYFALLLLPSVFALFNTQRLSRLLWWFTYIVFVLFIGLRFEIGPDWPQYKFIHSTLAYVDFWDVAMQAEPLSYLLFWLSQHLGFEVYLSNVVAAIIVMTGVFSFARRTANPWVAVIAATPYFIIVMGMSGVRQAMAAGIVLFLFAHWERFSFISRGFYILFAGLFHTSALINNIFLVIKMRIPLRYKVILGILILSITLYISFRISLYSENIVRYQQLYLGNSLVEESFGSLYHIAMIVFPAFLGFLFRRRIMPNIHSHSLLYFGMYAALSIIMINFFSSTAASRLTIYLYFVPMMVYPALIHMYRRRTQLALTSLLITVHAAILAVWFTLGNHSFAYVPYKNLLFDNVGY